MIDKKTVEHIATLARLKLPEEEIQELTNTFSKILNSFDQIAKISTDGVEPLRTPTEISAIWRADEVKIETTTEEIVANAPHKTGNLFTVPPVV